MHAINEVLMCNHSAVKQYAFVNITVHICTTFYHILADRTFVVTNEVF